jgi:glycosyltransferase involved in cell wall biosynthesis
MSGAAATPGPVVYLTGEYPRATDTFIQREVAGLRALGVTVLTSSIRRTDPAHHVGDEQREEARRTFCVLPAARNPIRLFGAHAAMLRRSPRRYLAALGLGLWAGAPGLRGLLYQLFYFAEAGVLADHMRRVGAFHLHNHFGNSSCSVAMLASTMSGTPYSYMLHGPAELFEPMRWRIDLKIARAAFVSCISNFARSQGMLFSDQAHWPRMHVVHCGVAPALYDRAEKREDGPPTLLFVGRLAAIKGLAVLLEAIATLRAHRPDLAALRLVLVGDGPERSALEARAAALGLGAVVEFTGYLSQTAVAERLAQADVFVLPSFAEGVPVVLMEALASRTPVVATRVAGVAELVEDGVSGLLIPPGDPAPLADALARLLGDSGLRARMGAAGREIVAAEFDAAREAARLLTLIRAYRLGGEPPTLRPEPAPADVPAHVAR